MLLRHTLLLLLCSNLVSAQTNLVVNPGFEHYNNCPVKLSNIEYSPSYTLFPYVKDWVKPTIGSSDFFHKCSNSFASIPYIIPHVDTYYAYSGDGMAGIYAYANDSKPEYLQSKLSQPLVKGEKYYVSFYYSLFVDDTINFDIAGIDRLGMNLSEYKHDDFVANILKLDYGIATQKGIVLNNVNEWKKAEGIYTAIGGEEWITIGTFDEGVPIYQTHLTGNGSGDYRAYFFIDDVNVSPTPTNINDIDGREVYSISPNPFASVITINNPNNSEITIYNSISQVMYHQINTSTNLTKVNTGTWPAGIYHCSIKTAIGHHVEKIVKQ